MSKVLKQLSIEAVITVKELLEIRLSILEAQITSGSYRILDMPSLTFPVCIRIDNDLRIRFEIEGNLQSDLSKKIREDTMKAGMIFVQTSISQLMSRSFPTLAFDGKKDIIGYWYFGEGYVPLARWENENFSWLRE